MSSTLLSPGVVVNEIDWSTYVANASTCIVGLVITARRGPTVPTLITNQKDFISTYGNPVTADYGGYCAYEALSQANQVYIQRVMLEATNAIAGVSGTDKLIFSMIHSGTDYNDYRIILTYTTDDDIKVVLERDATAAEISTYNAQFSDKGAYSDTATYAVKDLVTDGGKTYECIKATTAGSKVTDTTSWKEHEALTIVVLETYSGLSITTTSDNFILNKINNVSDYVKVALMDTGTVTSKIYKFSGGTSGARKGTAGTNKTPFKITTKYYDSTLNYNVVVFGKPDAFGYFTMTIYKPDLTTVVETIKDLTLNSSDERYVVTMVEKASNNIVVEYNTAATEGLDTYEYVIMGGSDGVDGVTTTHIIAGLEQFSNPEVLDINVLSAPGWYQNAVTLKGLEVCKTRGDSIYIAGTPYGLTPQEANDFANASGTYVDQTALNSSYGAIYWPWVEVSDAFKNSSTATIWLPPEGNVIAQYAYSDANGEPWFAPAGLNRGVMIRVRAIERSATKGERDLIYGNRNIINPIISYKSDGIVIWGQKTMQRKASALDRVNVRRLMNYMEKIISTASNYYVFEPNDRTAWDKWVDMVTPKLENIKTLRGITAYKVMMAPTSDEIANNTMPGTVYVKPTKSAEFLPINFVLMPQNYDFSTIGDTTINA
jgi:phage tail sheath protein FI